MKKILLTLLLSSGCLMAQTKTVVSPFGEKVTINPYANNGLTATNGYVQLGGALTQPSILTTSSSYTLAFSGLQSGLSTDNILVTDPTTGVLKMISVSAFNPYYWGVKGNAGTNPATNFLGTTDNVDLLFKTNALERIRIKNNGFTGIGLATNTLYGTTPKYMLDVVDDIHLISNRINYSSARLIFENQQVDLGGNQGSGMYMLDGQDDGARREWFFGKPYNNVGSGGKSSFVLKSMQTNALDYSLAQNGNGVNHLYVDALNNRIGIGTVNPTTALEVTATANPLKLNGLQAGATGDQMLTVDNTGVVRKMDVPSSAATRPWLANGNAGTNASTDFVGTTDANDLIVKTNSTERMRVKSNGNVGIGTLDPSNALEVTATANPLKLNGLQIGSKSDYVLTVDDNGVVRKKLLYGTGFIQGNGVDKTWVINDPNVTDTSVIFTIMKGSNSDFTGSMLKEISRVPGVSITVSHTSGNPASTNTYFEYLIMY
nr:hypothetical protein [uncultured Flavobacterium sp.]